MQSSHISFIHFAIILTSYITIVNNQKEMNVSTILLNKPQYLLGYQRTNVIFLFQDPILCSGVMSLLSSPICEFFSFPLSFITLTLLKCTGLFFFFFLVDYLSICVCEGLIMRLGSCIYCQEYH